MGLGQYINGYKFFEKKPVKPTVAKDLKNNLIILENELLQHGPAQYSEYQTVKKKISDLYSALGNLNKTDQQNLANALSDTRSQLQSHANIRAQLFSQIVTNPLLIAFQNFSVALNPAGVGGPTLPAAHIHHAMSAPGALTGLGVATNVQPINTITNLLTSLPAAPGAGGAQNIILPQRHYWWWHRTTVSVGAGGISKVQALKMLAEADAQLKDAVDNADGFVTYGQSAIALIIAGLQIIQKAVDSEPTQNAMDYLTIGFSALSTAIGTIGTWERNRRAGFLNDVEASQHVLQPN